MAEHGGGHGGGGGGAGIAVAVLGAIFALIGVSVLLALRALAFIVGKVEHALGGGGGDQGHGSGGGHADHDVAAQSAGAAHAPDSHHDTSHAEEDGGSKTGRVARGLASAIVGLLLVVATLFLVLLVVLLDEDDTVTQPMVSPAPQVAPVESSSAANYRGYITFQGVDVKGERYPSGSVVPYSPGIQTGVILALTDGDKTKVTLVTELEKELPDGTYQLVQMDVMPAGTIPPEAPPMWQRWTNWRYLDQGCKYRLKFWLLSPTSERTSLDGAPWFIVDP